MKHTILKLTTLLFASLAALHAADTPASLSEPMRNVVSLNGMWEIEQTRGSDAPPTHYTAKAPVPGLVDMAIPAFADAGIEPARTFYWYRRSFSLNQTIPETVLLKINKAKFSTTIYLNGKEIATHLPNYTPVTVDVRPYLKAENELVIRVGGRAGQNSALAVTGDAGETYRFLPGIYDDVSLILAGKPYMENVQVAPDINNQQVRVMVQGAGELAYRVLESASGKEVAAGTSSTNDFTIPLPGCKLWSPESPFLYSLELKTAGDCNTVKFGMREFRADSQTQRTMLNGKPYFLRGTNVVVFRFFEDADRGNLPWDRDWVRALFRSYKSLNWNSLRFHKGFPPEFWYDIADEEGILIQDEWPNHKRTKITAEVLEVEFREWMRERWNHPSVVIWDAANETWSAAAMEAVKRVRSMDLSRRPWDLGWNEPLSADDVTEYHLYMFNRFHIHGSMDEAGNPNGSAKDDGKVAALVAAADGNYFKTLMALTHHRPYSHGPRVEDPLTTPGPKRSPEKEYPNPRIINEYGYLWLLRDASPTYLTADIYERLFGETTADQRRHIYARYVTMQTEYWRATRDFAGVMQFCGLGSSRKAEGTQPMGATSDLFSDVKTLAYVPEYKQAFRMSFSPVIAVLDFWDEVVNAKQIESVKLVLLNDLAAEWTGPVTVRIEKEGSVVASKQMTTTIPPYGKTEESVALSAPLSKGSYRLVSSLNLAGEAVESIREFTVR